MVLPLSWQVSPMCSAWPQRRPGSHVRGIHPAASPVTEPPLMPWPILSAPPAAASTTLPAAGLLAAAPQPLLELGHNPGIGPGPAPGTIPGSAPGTTGADRREGGD